MHNKLMKIFNPARNEKGQILILTLLFIFLGSTLIIPLLAFIGTGLKTGQIFENKTNQLYAADAGIEDGKWKIKYDHLDTLNNPGTYNPYDYTTAWTYPLDESGDATFSNVNVSIKNEWIPIIDLGVSPFNTVSPGDMATQSKLMVISQAQGNTYKIRISYTWHNTTERDSFKINTLGIWLPSGFTYAADSCNLGDTYLQTPIPPYDGGTALIWNFGAGYPFVGTTSPSVAPFPGVDKNNTTIISDISLTYTPVVTGTTPNAVAWITTNLTDVPYTWDADKKFYRVVSESTGDGGYTVDAFVAKNELRQLSSSFNGNYFPIGNSLIGGNLHSPDNYHYQLYNSTQSTIGTSNNEDTGIPSSAHIEGVYLYWTGWMDWHNYNPPINYLLNDNCDNLNAYWDTTGSGGNQTRVPTSDGDINGTWNPALCWDNVNETTPNDSNYMTGSGSASSANTGWLNPTGNNAISGGDNNGFEQNAANAYSDGNGNASNINGAGDRHLYYGYNTSSIPAGSTVTGVEVRLDWWLESTFGTNSVNAELSWNGGTSWTSAKTASTERTSDGNPTDTLGNSSDTWGHGWTLSELSNSNFRVRLTCNSDSSSRDFYLDWVPVRITYTTPSATAYKLFNFSPFTVPAGASISDLTLFVRARDDSSGTNNIIPRIKIGGSYFDGTSFDPPSSFNPYTTFNYTWPNNPATGTSWTISDINSSLQQFGVCSTDLNPGVRVSMVYAQVRWTFANQSLWSDGVSTYLGQYQGQGSGSVSANDARRLLTLKNNIDLTPYASSTVNISWDQDESGTLESNDTLYYAFSGDGGLTWSSDYVAFSDDNPSSSFASTIPSIYKTDRFKMRFSFNFNASDEYVYLDNIQIFVTSSLRYPSNPTAENLKELVESTARVNKVLFNNTPITADKYEVLYPSQFDGTDFQGTWFYTATADVTELIDTWITNGSIESNGEGTYTLGHYYVGTDPSADNYRVNARDSDYSFNFYNGGGTFTGYPLGTPSPSSNPDNRYTAAHGGWSLLTLYSSPGTLGHQLYLYDINNLNFKFFFGWQNNVDFDNDGQPGGTITNFLVPKQIKNAVLSVAVNNGGSGYTSAPYVNFTGGVGNGAVAVANLDTTTHRITSIDVLNGGSGYTTTPIITITGGGGSGASATATVGDEANAAKMTAFVGEGDAGYTGDYFKVNNSNMSNSRSPANNVWNGDSPGLTVPGVDIDTFYVPWGNPVENGIIKPGDTVVKIDIPTGTSGSTGTDGFTMNYLILSFRSATTIGNALSYLIH